MVRYEAVQILPRLLVYISRLNSRTTLLLLSVETITQVEDKRVN